eukprot:4707961-Pleurochrysis_carterae.AAC.1
MDRIQDRLRQRTSMDSYQRRSWFHKFMQEPMLAKMFRKFTKVQRASAQRAECTKQSWTCTSPEQIRNAVELSGAGMCRDVDDRDRQGLQVWPVPSHGGRAHDNALGLHGGAVCEEREGVLQLHVRTRGRGRRAYASSGQELAQVGAGRREQGAAAECGDSQCQENGAERLSDEPAMAGAIGGGVCDEGGAGETTYLDGAPRTAAAAIV